MAHVVETVEKLVTTAEGSSGNLSRVIVISTYVIGKERILLAVRHPGILGLYNSGFGLVVRH